MAAWLIAVVGVVYALVALNLYRDGQMGLSIAFIGYAFANIGLYLEAK